MKKASSAYVLHSLREYTRTNRLLTAFKLHHADIKKAVASLQRHMLVKRNSMNLIMERWRREFINLKRWEEDLKVILKEEFDFSLKDNLYLLGDEYMLACASLYIDLEMVKFLVSNKRNALMTAVFTNKKSKQETVVPALLNLERQLKERLLFQDFKAAQPIESSSDCLTAELSILNKMLEIGDKAWTPGEFELKFPQYLFQALTFVELKRRRTEQRSEEAAKALSYQDVMKVHLQKLARQASSHQAESSVSVARTPH